MSLTGGTDHVEAAIRRLKIHPIAGIGLQHGDRDPRYGQQIRFWVVADEGLFRFDYRPGPTTPQTDIDSRETIPARSLSGERVEWESAPALTAEIVMKFSDQSQDHRMRVELTLGDLRLVTAAFTDDSTTDEELSLEFAREYWTRRDSVRPRSGVRPPIEDGAHPGT